MKLRISNKEHRRMAGICLVSLALGLISGFCAKGDVPDQEAVRADSIGEICILPDTALTMELHYTACGHKSQIELDKPEWIGLTKQEIADRNPGDSIAVFSSDAVCLIRVLVGGCDAHLRLGIHESGQLCVYRRNVQTQNNETVLLLSATAGGMDANVQKSLQQGILFDTMDEINAYLESVES